MNTALALAPRISFARIRTRRGDAWLDILAVIAFALSALMALTVAGGVYMFRTIDQNPAVLGPGPDFPSYLTESYVILSYTAVALIVIPISALGAAAARLGARGRTQRLASMRLLGMTTSQTTIIALVETIAQWTIGVTLGTILYYVTLPTWHLVAFFDRPIDPSLMRLPAGYVALMIVALFAIALLSTIQGLARVRISPLGVSKRESAPALRAWRLVFLVVVVMFFLYWSSGGQNLEDTTVIATIALLILAVIAAVNVVGPWLLQIASWPLTRSGRPSILLAGRRIADDPRAAWRPISAIALIALILGVFAGTPAESTVDIRTPWLFTDMLTGVYITLGFGFAVAACSTLMNQASVVFDRAEQTAALAEVGFPRRVFSRTRFVQIIGPLIITCLGALGLGVLLSAVLATSSGYEIDTSNIVEAAATLAIGWAMCAVALLMCEPLERHVLANRSRRND